MPYLWKHDKIPTEAIFVKPLCPASGGIFPRPASAAAGKRAQKSTADTTEQMFLYLPFTAFSLMSMASCRPYLSRVRRIICTSPLPPRNDTCT